MNHNRSVLMSSSYVIPHPQRPTYSGPGGRRPPGQRRPQAAHRAVSGRRRLEGCVPRGRGFSFARATSISPRTTDCHPPYPISCIPSVVRTGRKGFHPTNQPTIPSPIPVSYPVTSASFRAWCTPTGYVGTPNRHQR